MVKNLLIATIFMFVLSLNASAQSVHKPYIEDSISKGKVSIKSEDPVLVDIRKEVLKAITEHLLTVNSLTKHPVSNAEIYSIAEIATFFYMSGVHFGQDLPEVDKEKESSDVRF